MIYIVTQNHLPKAHGFEGNGHRAELLESSRENLVMPQKKRGRCQYAL